MSLSVVSNHLISSFDIFSSFYLVFLTLLLLLLSIHQVLLLLLSVHLFPFLLFLPTGLCTYSFVCEFIWFSIQFFFLFWLLDFIFVCLIVFFSFPATSIFIVIPSLDKLPAKAEDPYLAMRLFVIPHQTPTWKFQDHRATFNIIIIINIIIISQSKLYKHQPVGNSWSFSKIFSLLRARSYWMYKVYFFIFLYDFTKS